MLTYLLWIEDQKAGSDWWNDYTGYFCDLLIWKDVSMKGNSKFRRQGTNVWKVYDRVKDMRVRH